MNYCACVWRRPAVLGMLMYSHTLRFLRAGGHHQPPARYVNQRFPRTILCAALSTAAIAPAALARDIVVSVGASTTSTHDYATPAAFVDGHGDSRRIGRFTWQPVVSLGWIDGRDHAHLANDVFVLGAGVRLVDWWRRAFFGFQLGYAHDTNDALSSHGQFISSVGWQGERVVWTLRHISNGKVFPGRNLGETMLLAGVRF